MSVIFKDIETYETLEALFLKTLEALGYNAVLDTIDYVFNKVENGEPFDTKNHYFESYPDDIENIINGTIDIERLSYAMEHTHESYYWFVWVYYEIFKSIKISNYNSLELPDRTIEALWKHPPTVQLSFDYLDHVMQYSFKEVTVANGFMVCDPFIRDVDHFIKLYCIIKLHIILLKML